MPPTPEQIALARKYEPILYFHKDERFFPVDPKRYIEECALWSARRPTRSRDDWGEEAAGSFPKSPRTPARKIAAVQTATETLGRTWLGALRPRSGEDQFLGFAPWEDSASVTAATQNRHSSLGKIAEAYRVSLETAGLAASRFWYYAEILDKQALAVLARLTPAEQRLNLPLADIALALPDPRLILYHLFYPAHEEPLEGCEGFGDGSQFASFAGEWSCVAVLELDGEPQLIGLTQRNVGALTATDDDRRIGMTVQPWSNVIQVDGHPKVFVARGTHGNYLSTGDSGQHVLKPFTGEAFDISRNSCGTIEAVDDAVVGSVSVTQPEPRHADPIVLLKVALPGLLLPFGGGAAVVVGAVWALGEALADELGTQFGSTGAGPSPEPKPTDITPSGNQFGTVIHPLNVSVPEPVTSTSIWRTSAQAAPGGEITTADGKKYGFVVDRTTQVWWRTRRDQPGYDGRWGAAVDHDPKARRSGMRLPEFWRMFLIELARLRPP